MAVSFAIILFLGIILYQMFTLLKLPGFLGVLALGMMLGPYGFDWIDNSVLVISPELRSMALIIILLRAGLGLERKTLKLIGRPALLLGVVPALAEGFCVMLFAFYLIGMSVMEAGMLGFIVAAVSPAVIVPRMLYFIEVGKGTDKGIPAMILAGASLDDVVAITVFSSFAGWYAGSQVNMYTQIISIPVSLIVGIIAGIITGLVLLQLFKQLHMRNTMKLLIILAFSVFLTSLESMLKNIIPFAALIGVMVVGFVIYDKRPALGRELSGKLSRFWVFAEIMLFFLVGAEVNFLLIADSGISGLIIISAGLLARAAGVWMSLVGTDLSHQEKFFCMISYSPKATVQAALGSVPLLMGAPYGHTILVIAVLSIILTAPVGAVATQIAGRRILKETDENPG